MNGGKTQIFGNEIMVVLSGSMSPTFDTGSIVAVKQIPYSEIQKGDIVTFEDMEKRTVTHRVIDIVDGNLVTKGDANDGKDTDPVTADRVKGKVQYSVPYIGYFIEFVKSPTGMLVFLAVPGLYLMISQIWKLLRMIKQQDEAAKPQV
ncbi:MAG: family signal peptidase [Brevibacillus sp.]|nr:family signal peptidase [Brevibacillus sp.]